MGIIELSAQWSDGGARGATNGRRDVLFAKLIVQKRAVPLFREALLLTRCT